MKIKEFLLNNWKKILFFIVLCICFFLTNKYIVKAATYNMNYEYYQQYYDNSGSSVTSVSTTWNESLQSYVSGNITTVANSYGAGLSISSPIPLLANHTYSMSIYFDGLSNVALSSKNHISIGTSLSNASSNYVNGNYLTTMNYSSVSNNTILKFAFTTSSNGTFIFIPWTTTSTLSQSYVLTQISIDDLGSGGVSQSDIDNSLNNQTNIIQNSINDMENSINDNIKDTFEDCSSKNLLKLVNSSRTTNGVTFTSNSDGSITINGTSTAKSYFNINEYYNDSSHSLYFTLQKGKTYTSYLGNSVSGLTMITRTKSQNKLLLKVGNTSEINSQTYSGPTDDEAFSYLVVEKGLTFNNLIVYPMVVQGSYASIEFEPYKIVCTSKIDKTNEELGNLNDSINNSDSSDATNSAGNFFSGFETDTFGLTSIITAPLDLIGSITSSSCSPLPLTIPYVNKSFNLPCMTTIYENYFGDFLTIYQTITFGIVAYWVCVRIFNLVKDFKNPDHDEIEVLDL